MTGTDRSATLRSFFARYVSLIGGARSPLIEKAFAAVPREPFAGPGPWQVHVSGPDGSSYLNTPDDDPAFLYQDTLIALDAKRGINIGHPSSHASWLDALAPRMGETVVQIGSGSGYYTSILAHLVGESGQVQAYEIDDAMAERAAENLRPLARVALHHRSGLGIELPSTDAIYVNAAVTQPSWAWLDALRIGGRLLFPLHERGGDGGMLLIEKPPRGLIWPARFVTTAAFIACEGGQDATNGPRLTSAFRGGGMSSVRSFRIDEPKDATCWLSGGDWWLSTAEPDRA